MSETIPDVPPQEVWQALQSDPKAKLVDVRTTPEWNFVGVPDLKELGKAPVKIEWQVYPSMSVNSDFLHKLKLEEVEPGDKVYFLCRSGVRSLAAALERVCGARNDYSTSLYHRDHRIRSRRRRSAGRRLSLLRVQPESPGAGRAHFQESRAGRARGAPPGKRSRRKARHDAGLTGKPWISIVMAV